MTIKERLRAVNQAVIKEKCVGCGITLFALITFGVEMPEPRCDKCQ